MNVIMESLGDPIWQIGGRDHHSGSAGAHSCPAEPRGSSLIVAPMALDPTHAGGMPLTLPCAQCGSGLVSRSECRSHRRACGLVDSSFVFWGLSPSPTPFPSLAPSLSASPSPTPIPSLTPSTAQVLTTFCDAIDRHDLDTAWGQYAKALQKERATPPPFLVRITIVHCRVDNVSETSATGFLLLKTIGPKGYTDDYERDFQFTLDVEEGVWKIAQVARCLADGCLDDTTSVVP